MLNSSEVKSSVKVVGLNGQISLGKEFAGKQVLVEEREPGVWLVRTALVIPENELWLHQPATQAALQRAMASAQANPPKVTTDVDAFLETVSHERTARTTGPKQPRISGKLAKAG